MLRKMQMLFLLGCVAGFLSGCAKDDPGPTPQTGAPKGAKLMSSSKDGPSTGNPPPPPAPPPAGKK